MSSDKRHETLVQFQTKALLHDVWASCLNCHNWRPNTLNAGPSTPEECAKFNIKPPLRVIVLSCSHWLPNIPF